MKRILSVVVFLFAVCNINADSPATDGIKEKTHKAHQEVFTLPFDQAKFDAYKATLPRDGGYYIVEGDMLLNNAELYTYVVNRLSPEKKPKPLAENTELSVNILPNGKRDFYEDPNRRDLTYAVDSKSFPSPAQYDVVVASMRAAGKDWQDACSDCRLKFTHLSEHDANALHKNVNFIVRYRDVKGEYVAAAFFPHDGAMRRYINIDPSYFTTRFDKVGVLRHELGHVIGYRHEGIDRLPICYRGEDNLWQPITPYDAKSVMHYFCGGGGSLALTLSDGDKSGHTALYKLPAR